MAESRRFPIDALLVSRPTADVYEAAMCLVACLSKQAAVRSYGMTWDPGTTHIELAMRYIAAGLANTVFVDPRTLDSERNDTLNFISEVRTRYPKIVFVLYTSSDFRETLIARGNANLAHYLHLTYMNSDYLNLDALREVLLRCEEWHSSRFEYDIGISFAGEDRDFAEDLARDLRKLQVKVFFDQYQTHDILGKNLTTYLYDIYGNKCRFCVPLISTSYVNKRWPKHEWAAANERNVNEAGGHYLLPVRLDDCQFAGLSPDIACMSIEDGSHKIAETIVKKLWITPDQGKKTIGVPASWEGGWIFCLEKYTANNAVLEYMRNLPRAKAEKLTIAELSAVVDVDSFYLEQALAKARRTPGFDEASPKNDP